MALPLQARRIKISLPLINNFQYLYGPVSSWRLGVSLGIDPISGPGDPKRCSFNCIYCQRGST
jgi:wyosine [tRNA(Phe)-imidazoG37] synthetase (radical SAM superfamily)